MGKCFLGLGFGAAMALAYLGEELARPGADVWHCVSGMAEWAGIGLILTACALTGYAVWLLCERWVNRP